MLGTQLVDRLEQLGVIQPGSLSDSDLDWVFMGADCEPLSAFFTWFCDNVSSADVLSEEELQKYHELEQSGQVLQGSALEAMAGCLVGVGKGEGYGLEELLPQHGPDEDERLQKELIKLDLQLKRLNLRKDQLSIQQLSTSSLLSDNSSAEQAARTGAVQQLSAALAAAQEHTEALAKLAQATDKLALLLSTVDEDCGGFLVSTDLSPWQEHEQQYTDALLQHFRTHFSQNDNGGDFVADQEGYKQKTRERMNDHHNHLEYTDELRRLHQLVQDSVVRREREEPRAAQHKAEAEEAGRALERLKRGHYGALAPSTLQQECATAAAAEAALSAEVARQQRAVLTLATVAAQRPATAALAADCNDKRRRQERANSRQQQVVSLLVSQLSRMDCLSIMQQCEEAALRHTLQQVQHASAFLSLHHHRAQQRTDYLSSLSQRVQEDRALDRLPPQLAPLARLVQSPDSSSSFSRGQKDADIISYDAVTAAMADVTMEAAPKGTDVTRLVSGLTEVVQQRDVAQQQLASLHQPHTVALHRLRDKCDLLEDCLSGSSWSGRLPGTLPACWLPPHLLDQQAELEGQAHHLKTAMIDLLQQHEDKKRVVSAQPDVAARLCNWTAPPSSGH